MEFKQLEIFVALAKTKSFSKAAQKLYLTQPAITNSLQKLEDSLGTTLVNRKTRQITLTESGQLLLQYAVSIINMRDQALFNLKEKQEAISGNLELYASTIPAQYLLPKLVKDFCICYPQVNVSIRHADSLQVADDILQGFSNLGLVGSYHDSESLLYHPLMDDKVVLITSSQRQIDHKKTFPSIQDLVGETLILREEGSGTRKILEQVLSQKNLDLSCFQHINQVENNETIKNMVALDLGVSFVSELSIQNELSLGILNAYSMEDLSLDRCFYLVYTATRHLSPVEASFKNFVLNQFHQLS